MGMPMAVTRMAVMHMPMAIAMATIVKAMEKRSAARRNPGWGYWRG
ncbi:hypothetical protein GCM10022405_11460 [Gibbsiella dentisursi]|uniref:Uncharacterized protein n=1 Tax=Gibbsiella dentisursi TaxID=796890 RepID=A0ABP7KWL0_9GAMM